MMKMLRKTHHMLRPALGALLAVAWISGCAEEADLDDTGAQPRTISRGIISASFNRYIEIGSPVPYEQFGLMGMFARFDERRHQTVENLLEGNGPEVDLALDSCTVPAPVLDEMPDYDIDDQPGIELMDVGDLSVSYDRQSRPVPTRTFPDLLQVVVGVIYSAEEAHGVQFKPGARYQIRATGTDLVARFQVALDAPDDLGEIKVDGVSPTDQQPLVQRGEDIEISWEGDGYGDEVVATLTWMSMGAAWSMTCRMRDDGLFVVPGAHTSGLPDPLTCSDEELTLSRVRQVAFRGEGLLSGTFRFMVSTNFPVTF